MLRSCMALIVLQIWNCRPWDCQADQSENVKLRLVNGGSPCAGRVEIHYKDNWGTVNSYDWDLPDAAVVCRQLGCGAALKAPIGSHFGKGSGPVLTWNVHCRGSEAALRECESHPWGLYDKSHDYDAGVICTGHRVPRLISGADQCSGRLEVEIGESRGTMCDRHWDMNEANVVCNQLQCGVAVSVPRGAHFGEGTGLIHSDVFQCKGNESSLWDCLVSSGTHQCKHRDDVSVICSGNHGPRLVGGKNRCSGRVEVLHGDQWGTLCDVYFSLEDAAVVCEHLKCGAVDTTHGDVDFGEGTGPVWKEKYLCGGNESRLSDCPVSDWGKISCSHRNDAGLICSDASWSLRLTNGGSRCDGQVETYYNGSWGRVQDNFWNINDSNVVCRELRCGVAISAYNYSRYGETVRQVWVNEVQCDGNESQLRNCRTFTWNRSSSDSIGVGVLCSDHLQVRLSGGEDTCAGRLEIYYNGSWGTVCNDLWDLVDANVVCKQLGCGYALEGNLTGYCGRSSGRVWLDDVRCSGNESFLWECPSAQWGEHDCSHKEDVIVTCSEHKEMRLVNGERRCEGRVEVLYNGTWGTVCSEEMDEKAAQVICKQMHCGPIKSIDYGSVKYGRGSGPIWFEKMDCSSQEPTLWQCQSDPWRNHNCFHMDDAGVACEEPKIPESFSLKACDGDNESQYGPSAELPLRLVGGSNNCSGTLEIQSNNSWGTVCDDSWDLADASVVCRQLKCGPARWSPAAAKITQGAGDIWLDEVKCTGSESLLSSCRSSPLVENDCHHKEDVFVICSDPVLIPNGSEDSDLGNETSTILFAACITLGILLIAELFALMMIIRRWSARRGALMSGRDSPVGFYQAIYEEIENGPRGKTFNKTQDSASGSIDSINQIDYYSSGPLNGTVLGPECPEGNSSSVRDLVPTGHASVERKNIDSPDAPVLMDAATDDLPMQPVACGDLEHDESSSQTLKHPVSPDPCSAKANDKLHGGTLTITALSAPRCVDCSFSYFTSSP